MRCTIGVRQAGIRDLLQGRRQRRLQVRHEEQRDSVHRQGRRSGRMLELLLWIDCATESSIDAARVICEFTCDDATCCAWSTRVDAVS